MTLTFLVRPTKTESARHRADVGLNFLPYTIVEFAEPALPANQRQVERVGELVGCGGSLGKTIALARLSTQITRQQAIVATAS